MKISDPDKAATSMTFDALEKIDELLTKYTGDNWREICTPFNSPKNINGSFVVDRDLSNSLSLSENMELFLIHFGADWPENKILRKKLVNLREKWIEFVEKDKETYVNYIEIHYLNGILSSWEDNLGIQTVEKDDYSVRKILGWHHALALVILQEAGSLPLTIGKKELTIQQAMKHFDVEKPQATTIYHSVKKMKYNSKNDDIKWNIEYFFKTFAPKNHVGYKELVLEFLKDDEKAILLLNKLPD